MICILYRNGEMMNSKNVSNGLKINAYQVLKDRLVECIYMPGVLLNEAQLAAELQLSRTPIREAISKLESEGFVQVLPKKGILVSNITLKDVVEVFQTRMEIEPISLKLAAPHLPKDELILFQQRFQEPMPDIQNSFHLDTAMHLFIIEHCGNKYIIDMMHRVFEENTRIIISSKQNKAQVHDAKEEHLAILSLLLNDRFEEAEESMRQHIERCRQAAFTYFLENQIYSVSQTTNYKRELDKLNSANTSIESQ